MHTAKKSQIAVCKSFIHDRTEICSDWAFTRKPSSEDSWIRRATIPRFLRKCETENTLPALENPMHSVAVIVTVYRGSCAFLDQNWPDDG
jgi:hypothetical protein